MTLNKNLVEYLKSFNFTRWEHILAWLLLQKHNVDCDHYIDDDDFFILVSNNIIDRDYVYNKIHVKIPIYEGEGEIQMRQYALELKDDVSENIDKYRNLFKGIRLGSMGERQTCTKLLTAWLIKNPNYTLDEVITKTRTVLNRMREKGETQFIPNADNFIYTYTNGEEKSKLSAIIDEDVDVSNMI